VRSDGYFSRFCTRDGHPEIGQEKNVPERFLLCGIGETCQKKCAREYFRCRKSKKLEYWGMIHPARDSVYGLMGRGYVAQSKSREDIGTAERHRDNEKEFTLAVQNICWVFIRQETMQKYVAAALISTAA
jgi:hypothetical protein